MVEAALARARDGLPNHEDRPAQDTMADAVAHAIGEPRHLIVQAGTGTGKSLAYLVPALALGTRAVVSTATKALQDQLANRDLPLLARSLDVPVEFAVLKGRANYICRQRIAEVVAGDQQLVLDGESGASQLGALGREVARLVEWGRRAETGDRADLPWEPTAVAWAQVSVSSRECPGARECPSGGTCFAEAARERARQADVVVVNTHLYCSSLAIGEDRLLPPHDLVVFDEAHELEDIASAAFGFEIGAGRFRAVGRASRALLEDPSAALAVEESGLLLVDALRPHRGVTLGRPIPDATQEQLTTARERVNRLFGAVGEVARASHDSDEPTGSGRAGPGPADAAGRRASPG